MYKLIQRKTGPNIPCCRYLLKPILYSLINSAIKLFGAFPLLQFLARASVVSYVTCVTCVLPVFVPPPSFFLHLHLLSMLTGTTIRRQMKVFPDKFETDRQIYGPKRYIFFLYLLCCPAELTKLVCTFSTFRFVFCGRCNDRWSWCLSWWFINNLNCIEIIAGLMQDELKINGLWVICHNYQYSAHVDYRIWIDSTIDPVTETCRSKSQNGFSHFLIRSLFFVSKGNLFDVYFSFMIAKYISI